MGDRKARGNRVPFASRVPRHSGQRLISINLFVRRSRLFTLYVHDAGRKKKEEEEEEEEDIKRCICRH